MRGLTAVVSLSCLALAAVGCGSSSHNAKATPGTAPASSIGQQSTCLSEQQPGILADFGHVRSVPDANVLIARAHAVGFLGLVVQRRACHDFAVVVRGLRSLRQGHSLQREARTVGLRVMLDCSSVSPQGGLVAVFGHRRTRQAALRLHDAAERSGFKFLKVIQDRCDDWKVVLYGLKTAQERRSFAREARRVGFLVTFEPG